MKRFWRFGFVLSSLFTLASATAPSAWAQQPPAATGPNLTEPVYRISKNDASRVPSNVTPHALDPALQLARDGLSRVQQGVNDYTAVIVKRERVGDELGDHEYMFAKVRNRKVQNGQVVVPFSVYLMFLKPTSIKGREVVYVENRNDGKMTAHEGGMKRMLGTHHLEPTSWLAMQGQRYPITDLGIEMLLSKLIERGERSKTDPECKVSYTPNAKVSKRPCTILQVTHPKQHPQVEFHIAQIFIDDELQLPVRYAAYIWPKAPGAEPEVLEEYTYQDLKINVGLTDDDFNINNPSYNFSRK